MGRAVSRTGENGVVVTDLIQIKRAGEKKRGENESFRKFLKRHDFPERRFRRIAEEIEDAIDCTQCANCCRVATVRLLQRDVEHLARFLGLAQDVFLERYTTQSPDEGTVLRRGGAGCVFLDGNLCSIYDDRPDTCRNFPHLIRGSGSITSRMWQFVDRACYCPIVYNSLEAYKEVAGFRR